MSQSPATPLPIAEQLVVLAELASVDQEARRVNDTLEALPAAARKAEATATKLKNDLDATVMRRNTANAAKRSLEQEVADERIKIRKWESRANDIRGEREHTALSSEIGGAKRQIRRLEDDILEQMESIEAADKEVTALEQKHAAAAAEATAELAKVKDQIDAATAELNTLTGRQRALLDKLPLSVVKRYEQISSRRQGVGVAIINTKDSCGACHRAVPPQLVIQIMKGQVLETCPACQRFLVHHSMTAVAADSAAGADS